MESSLNTQIPPSSTRIPPSYDGANKPLAALVSRWESAIKAAKKHRKEEFDDVADEARNFFDGPKNFMWKDMEKQMLEQTDQGFMSGAQLMPQFKISINRMFDAVAMFGPALYHQNPTIAVTPRSPIEVSIDTYYAHDQQATQLLQMIPAMQAGIVADERVEEMAIQLQQAYEAIVEETKMRTIVNNDHAVILETLSNYYQKEGAKKTESRLAITEAIVTGLGLLEVAFETPVGGGPRIPQCRFLSNRDFLCDPDATYWRDVTFIVIRRCSQANKVEAKFKLPPGTLKGRHASNTALSGAGTKASKRHGDGKVVNVCHDMVEYYDVYSKNGAGQHLKIGEKDREITGLDSLGDFVYLAICPDCDYPLNLPPSIPIVDPVTNEPTMEALEATAWPAPFWDDAATDGGWPVTRLSFYENPGKTWPISMAKPCLPEMKFVNWIMSFLADGVAVGSKIYPAVVKSAAAGLREQLANGQMGPFTVLEIEAISGKSIDEIVSFLKAPAFNLDIYTMLERVNAEIDKRLGLTELAYGISNRQMRSAAEAQYRQSNINVRPDDMASQVEDWLSITATREIQMLRWKGEHFDVEPIIGGLGAQIFATQILTREVSSITREFTFRVEAGTSRKPNKDTRIAQLNEIGQYLLPVAQQAMQLGVTKPFNAFMEDYGRAMDIDPSRYMMDEQDQAIMLQFQAASRGPQIESQTEDATTEPQ